MECGMGDTMELTFIDSRLDLQICDQLDVTRQEVQSLRNKLEEKEHQLTESVIRITELKREAEFDRLRFEGEIIQSQRKITAQGSTLRQLRQENQVLKSDLEVYKTESDHLRNQEVLKLKIAIGRHLDLLSSYFIGDSIDDYERELRTLVSEREHLTQVNNELNQKLAALNSISRYPNVNVRDTDEVLSSVDLGERTNSCHWLTGSIAKEFVKDGSKGEAVVAKSSKSSERGTRPNQKDDKIESSMSINSGTSCTCDEQMKTLELKIMDILKQNRELKEILAQNQQRITELSSRSCDLEQIEKELKTISVAVGLCDEEKTARYCISGLVNRMQDFKSRDAIMRTQLETLEKEHALVLQWLNTARNELRSATIANALKKKRKAEIKTDCEQIISDIINEQ